MDKDKVKGGIDNAADKAKQFADNAADKAKQFADRAGGAAGSGSGFSASGLAGDASEFAHKAQETVQRYAGDAYNAARDAGHQVQRWAGDNYEVVGDRIGDFGSEVTSFIRRNPLPALLIGFGVGLMIGRAARS